MIEVFDCEQGSPAWYVCRLGLPTASEFKTVLAQGRGGAESETRRTYLYKLVGEILTGEPMWNYTNEHFERGKQMEEEARDLYTFLTDAELTRVGFIKNHGAGCSPDSLIGKNGMLEVKTKLAHLQVEALLDGVLPPEHKAQVQGQLWIAEREWVDFVSYWPKLPLLKVRVHRDEPYIERLAKEVERFKDELQTLLARVQAGYAALARSA